MARRICWLEGERDVEALWAWGLPATTCAGGVEAWRAHAQDYIGQLVMAGCQELLVFRDHDLPGGRLQRAVARAALENGLKVKLVDLGYPETSGHGKDISDWIAEGHTKDELLALIEAAPWLTAPPLEPGEIPPPPPDPTEGDWPQMGPYLIHQGVLCRMGGKNGTQWPERLCNFRARVAEELLLDDAVTVTRMFAVEGWREDGYKLPEIRVPVAQFSSMGWIMEQWGIRATLRAGQSVKDYIREAMQLISRPGFRRLYTHTGWRRIGGDEWVYLSASGAVGRGGFEVDLGRLERYRLPSVPEQTRWAVQTSLKLLDVAPWSVTVPMLGSVYRAVLGGVIPSDYSLWLEGPTGSYKSSLAALFLSHWGAFSKLTLPENWSSSANFLERAAFTAKDAWLVIDDYHPAALENRQQEQSAARLIRAQGNLSGRGRLRQDLTMQTTFIPRGLIVGTGEQHPGGQSLVGRMLVLEVEELKVRMPLLTELQRSAWLLPHALAGFIEWLAPQMSNCRDLLIKTFEEARETALSAAKRHARIPEIIANCWLGVRALADYAKDVGALDEKGAEALQERAWEALLDIAEGQSSQIEDERPSRRFFSIAQTLLLQRRVVILRRNQSPDGFRPPPDIIGWDLDGEFFALDPGAYQVVARFARDAGEPFGLRQTRLYQDFLRENISEGASKGHTTTVSRIAGNVRRVIKVRKEAVTRLLGAPFVFETASESEVRDLSDQYQGDNPF